MKPQAQSRTRPSMRVLTLGALGLVASTCSGGGDGAARPTTTSTPASACPAKDGEKPAKALLRCTAGSVVFIENAYGTGTGVVIGIGDDRYVVTNLHVVDPFAAADVSAPGAETVEGVAVVGIDATADLALLGPLDEGDFGDPLPIAEGTDLERGDEVYLVGYPAETTSDDDLESTISSGIVSRVRNLEEYDQSYIQTDASIAGGQSGGPLFDESGRVVGISGLSFGEGEFALALSGRNVSETIEALAEEGGDDYLALPTDADADGESGETSGAVEFADPALAHVLYIPASDDRRDLEFTVDPAARPIVLIESFADEEPLAASLESVEIQQELAERLAQRQGGDPSEIPDASAFGEDPKLQAAQVAPGSFRVELPADEPVSITIVAPLIEAPTTVAWTSSQPAWVLTPSLRSEAIEAGDTVDKIVNGVESSVELTVDLAADQEVELHARSPQSDVGFAVIEPGVTIDPLWATDPTSVDGTEFVDDTDDGLYGLDARQTYTAKTAGTYRIRLYHNDGTTVAIRFSVTDCADDDCD